MRKLLRSVARHNMKCAGIQHMNRKGWVESPILPATGAITCKEVRNHEVE